MDDYAGNQQGLLYLVGTRGYSAYEVAVQNGFVGTEEEWLASLKGEKGEQGTPFDELTPEQKEEIRGDRGYSSYEIAVQHGFIGTEEEWVNSFLTPDGYYNKAYIDNIEDAQNIKLNKKPYYYNTLADMKADNSLKNGDYCITLGFYEINDGGGAEYRIYDQGTADNYFIHTLSNGRLAELIIRNNTVNVKQVGARNKNSNNEKYDIKPYILAYMSYLDNISHRVKLYIPSGVWYCSGVELARNRGFEIEGDISFSNLKCDGTTLVSLNDNQDYIIKIGNTVVITTNWGLKNIAFTTAEPQWDSSTNGFIYNQNNIKNINGRALELLYATHGITDNIFFRFIKGQALKIVSSWENYFGLLNFRGVSNHESSVFCIGTADTTLVDQASSSASIFEKVMFEAVHGDLIELETRCRFTNNHFGVINFEDARFTCNGEQYTEFTDEILDDFDDESAYHYSVFRLHPRSSLDSVIDSIELNNVSYRYCSYNDKNYLYDILISIDDGDNAVLTSTIQNISIVGMSKDMRLLSNSVLSNPSTMCTLNINSVVNRSSKSFIFDVNNFYIINCDCLLQGQASPKIGFLGNEFTPFYKIVNRTNYPAIFSDKYSNNNLHLVFKPIIMDQAKMIVGGTKINMRAKVPEQETVILGLIKDNAHYTNVTLEGTGEYKNYEFDISNKFTIGDEIFCRLSNSSESSNCYLDYYKFY